MAASRTERQQAIREIVRATCVRTQKDLVDELGKLGFAVTQATVSRDITDLELCKDEQGCYVFAEDLRFAVIVKQTVRQTKRAGNQVLVFTGPGSANSVAAALDEASPSGILGCIAGDDTILVIAADEDAGAAFQARIDSLIV